MKFSVFCFLLTLVTPIASAIELEIFCTESVCERSNLNEQVILLNKSNISVKTYFLDQGRVFEKTIEKHLLSKSPSNEPEGLKIINSFLNSDEGRRLVAEMNHAIDGINEAVQLDIEKIPAYVCSRKGVIYGGDVFNAAKKCREFVLTNQ
ncbi:DUF1525 domain-containing protein [Vibrio cholerae]|nr:DUF1525 domain-containing protein [Vibrio cholerae]HEJ2447570.1 DUF1525 domain-containing protein [Vibrio cholerae]